MPEIVQPKTITALDSKGTNDDGEKMYVIKTSIDVTLRNKIVVKKSNQIVASKEELQRKRARIAATYQDELDKIGALIDTIV